MNNLIPYGKQHITDEDVVAVVSALKGDFLTQGPKIQEFEEKFSSYVNAKYAVAVANGTAALHLCTLALGVSPRDKIITTPITFAASANCVRYCGGEVVFIDIDPNTLLLDIRKVETLLRSFPIGTYKGIIPVDFAGYPVNIKAFKSLADEFGHWIIEDACHAPGGYYIDNEDKKQMCGNGLADLSIFSFHPVKHIACGEGGIITTNNKSLYEKLLLLRTHGITKDPSLMHENHGGWYMEMQTLGYNYRMPDILAALGVSQLSRADEGLAKRHEIAKRYDEAFLDTCVKTIHVTSDFYHAYHLYVVQVNNRKVLYDKLREKNIFTQIHYIPVHTMPYYKDLGYKKGDYPVAEKYYEGCISLPMYPTLTDEEQEYVIKMVREFAK